MKHPLPERIVELNREIGVPLNTVWGAHIRAEIIADPFTAIFLIDHLLDQRDELLTELVELRSKDDWERGFSKYEK